MWWWLWVVIPVLFFAWASWKLRGRVGDGKEHPPGGYGGIGGGGLDGGGGG